MWMFVLTPLIAAVTWTAPRLLGTRPRPGSGAWCAAAGVGVAAATAWLTRRAVPDTFTDPGLLLMVALLASMATAVGLELLGGPRLPGPVTTARAVRAAMRRSLRYASLMRLASRHGLPLTRSPRSGLPRGAALGAVLRGCLAEAGPLFIKAGQMLASRPGLLPQETAAALADLNDTVPPAEPHLIDKALNEHYGAPVTDVFASFDHAPLAAASMAQVHRARLPDGTEVAVKILRPDAPSRVHTDLDVLSRLARTLERRTEWGRSVRLTELVDDFAETVRDELDLRVEARTLATAHAATDHRRLRVPAVHSGLSGRTVLVQGFADGTPVHRAASGLSESDAREAADSIAAGYLDLLLRHGIAHADPHPGNIHLDPALPPALLDFGLSSRLDPLQLAALREAFTAVGLRDPAALATALNRAATRTADQEQLERACARLLLALPDAGADSPGSGTGVLSSLTALTSGTGLVLPRAFTAVLRGLGVLEATCLALTPGFDLTAHMGPRIRPPVTDIAGRFTAMLQRFSSAAAGPPARTAEHHALAETADRGILALVAATTGGISTVLLTNDSGPRLSGNLHVLEATGSLGLAAAAVLLMRVVMQTLRRSRPRPDDRH